MGVFAVMVGVVLVVVIGLPVILMVALIDKIRRG